MTERSSSFNSPGGGGSSNQAISDLLADATRSTIDKFNLRDGFYSEQDTPRHHLDDAEVDSHHMSDAYPHLRRQYGVEIDRPHHKHRHHGHHKHHRKRHDSDKAPGSSPTEDVPEPGTSNGYDAVDIPDVKIITPSDSELSARANGSAGSPTPATFTVGSAPTSTSVSLADDGGQQAESKDYEEEEKDTIHDLRELVLRAPSPNRDDTSRPTPHLVETSKPQSKVTFHLGGDPHDDESKIGSPKAASAIFSTSSSGQRLAVTFKVSPFLSPKKSHRSEHATEHPKSKGHKHIRIPSQAELASRVKRGSDVHMNLYGDPTDIEEAQKLSMLDLDEMTSHRFDEHKGMRRRKINFQKQIIASADIDKDKGMIKSKSLSDTTPHELFVQLDEMTLNADNEYQWSEVARWIKFEEDIEEGAQRWGKPHVASLSFHSLLELRKVMESCVMLKDLEASDMTTISNRVVDQMVTNGVLDEMDKSSMLRALLLRHKTMTTNRIRRNTSGSSLVDAFRNSSSASLEKDGKLSEESVGKPNQSLHPNSRRASLPVWRVSGARKASFPALHLSHVNSTGHKLTHMSNGNSNSSNHVKIDMDNNLTRSPSFPSTPPTEQKFPRKENPSILRRIPVGSEACSVLAGSCEFLSRPVATFVRLSKAEDLGTLLEVPVPVRFLFFVMVPDDPNKYDYHEIGRSFSTLMSNKPFHDTAYRCDSIDELMTGINEFLDSSLVLPPGDWDSKTLLPIMDMAKKKALQKKKEKAKKASMAAELERRKKEREDDPLRRTGKPFGGVIRDAKKRYPFYKSDILDGLNVLCLATVFFIFFAALSPAITFGGLLNEACDGWFGVSELLIGTAVCGFIHAWLATQPVTILGATGPILVFEEALFQICTSLDLDFISFHAWVGFWMTIITIVVVAFEGSFMVKFFTRFTEEIFAALISLIFIIEVFIKLAGVYRIHPLIAYYPTAPPALSENESALYDMTTLPGVTADSAMNMSDNVTMPPTEKPYTYPEPNTFLLSVILTFGTYIIASQLKVFRNGKFLGRTARRAIGDFGIPIAILIMVVIDVLIQDVYTDKLYVPDGLEVSDKTKRGWFINPLGVGKTLPVWAFFAAAIPAVLGFILVFMETQITAMIVNKKERNLKKGSGFHFDLLLLGCCQSFCAILGLPFMSGATVRSVTHISALSVYSKNNAPGEKPKLVEVKEQRLTAALVHVLIGVSVLLGPVLRLVPIPVLLGVFFYMGVASTNGIQLFERCYLLFMPVKHHPDETYVKVRTWKMHVFTLIQLIGLGILWAVKSTAAALAFPFVLILFVPMRRFLLPYLYTQEELNCLDFSGAQKENEEPEILEYDSENDPDFYEESHMPRKGSFIPR